MTLWEILKANKLGYADDMFTMLVANKMNGGRGRLHELSGIPPLSFTAKGKPLTAWSITGNTVQNGTPTPDTPQEVKAVGDRTGNLFDNSLLEQGGWKATAGTIPRKLLPSETNYTRRTRYNQIIPLLASTLSLYCPANIKINYVWIDANGISLGGSGFQKNGGTVTAPEQAVSMTFILGLDSDIECTPSDFSDINVVAGSIAPESYEPYGYKIPVVTSADGTEPITTPIYLPTPLYSGEVMRSDGTITRSDGTTETFTAPQIPTINGTTVIDVDTAVKPESMTIKYRR